MFWWPENEGFVLLASAYGTQRIVQLLYSTAQNWWDYVTVHHRESRMLKFLFITYLEQLLVWFIPKPHPSFLLEGASWNRLKHSHGVSKKWSSVHRDPSHVLSCSFSCLIKRKETSLLFPSDSVKWEDCLPSFKIVHRTGKLSSCLILPAEFTLFSPGNGLKKNRLKLQGALCENPCLPCVKLFWTGKQQKCQKLCVLLCKKGFILNSGVVEDCWFNLTAQEDYFILCESI